MNRPGWRDVAARAWELRPAGAELVAVAAAIVAAVLVLDMAWWLAVSAAIASGAIVLGVLAWLDLAGEAEQEAASDEGAGGG
jgi:hypothetical protein